MYLGKSFNVILKEHEIDPIDYDKAMSDLDAHIWKKNYGSRVKNPCDSNVVQVPVEASEGIKPIGVSQPIRGTKEQMEKLIFMWLGCN